MTAQDAVLRKQQAVLRKLVAMKRQRAEQYVREVQARMREAEAEMSNLVGQLARMNQAGDGYNGNSLARRHGHVEHLLSGIATLRAALSVRQAELERAKEELKRVMHSEDQLSNEP